MIRMYTYKNQEPEWLRALKWFGVALAVGLGVGYYFLLGEGRAVSVNPRPTPTPHPPTSAVAVNIATPTAVLFFPIRPQSSQQIEEGAPAPDFTLKTLDGKATVSLSQFAGQPVLINFWASWCIPCRAEAADLEKAYHANKAQGFVLLGINSAVQDTEADAKAFVKQFGLTYLSLWDKEDAVPNQYGVLGLPTSIFVNRRGLIQRVHIGGMTSEQITDYVAEIIQQ